MEEANHKFTITSFVTQQPLETNRVDLDPDVKDDWGLPALRITSTSHPDDFKSMEFFRQKSIEILEAVGAKGVPYSVRGAWCVVRGAWCVVRGAWCGPSGPL